MVNAAKCRGFVRLSGEKVLVVSEKPSDCTIYVLVEFSHLDVFGTTSYRTLITDGDEFCEVINVPHWKYGARHGVTGLVLRHADVDIINQPPLMINSRLIDSGDVEFLKRTVNEWLDLQ